MTENGDRRFPAALAAAMAVRFECSGQDGVDFEPYESFLTAEPDWTPQVNQDLAAIAERFAPDRRASATAIIARAAQEFPDFDDEIMGVCR